MTNWIPDLSKYNGPRYQAIADAIAAAIERGELQPHQRLPTHRSLADALGVTVGTITRAYAEVERRGLVHARVGRGTFVRGGEATVGHFRIPAPPATDVIDLSLNLPLADDRSQTVATALQQLAQQPDALNALLSYQPDCGLRSHREAAAEWLNGAGLPLDADALLITNGGQHGIMVALMALTRPGDIILAEGLTYPGLQAITRHLNLRPQPLAMDQEGIIPEAFAAACQQFCPKVLYCTPTLQNPTTAIMSRQRREQLLEIAQRHHVHIIEDDVNGHLPAERPLPLAALAPEQVVYINSAAKVMAPGLRFGILAAGPAVRPQLAGALRASCWMASPLTAELACRWLRQPDSAQLLERQRQALRQRHALLQQWLGDFELQTHPESLHAWLQLPDPWRSAEFVRQAAAHKVCVLGADAFAVGQFACPQAVRISISSAVSLAQLELGLKRLQTILQSQPQPTPIAL